MDHPKTLGEMLEDTPKRTLREEREYRRGFLDGWIQAANVMTELMFLKDKRRIYDIMFDHWQTDLRNWRVQPEPLSCTDFPPMPDSVRCRYCGRPATSIDHVVPVSKGGKDEPDNLVPACRSCNSSKGSKALDDWTPPSVRVKRTRRS